MKMSLAGGAAIAAIVVAAAFFGQSLMDRREPRLAAPAVVSSPKPSLVPQIMAFPSVAPDAKALPSSSSPAPVVAVATLSQRVDALIASKEPVSLFAAYQLINACILTRELGGDSEDVQRSCGDLSPGQISSRFLLIKEARAAHIDGAAVAYLRTTPDGRPIDEIWSDPNYADWKRDAIEGIQQAAVLGDVHAMQEYAGIAARSGDKETALMYLAAYAEKTYGNGIQNANAAVLIKQGSSGLDPDKAADAIGQGPWGWSPRFRQRGGRNDPQYVVCALDGLRQFVSLRQLGGAHALRLRSVRDEYSEG